MYLLEDGMIEIVHIEPFSKRSRQAVLLVKWRWLKKTDAEVQAGWFDATPHSYRSIKDDFATCFKEIRISRSKLLRFWREVCEN